MSGYARFFRELPKLHVAVVGDLMLDTYFFGQVDRISPEAPVPVVTHQRQEERIGGAGNVALNLRSLGASVDLVSLIGEDEPGHILRKMLQKAGIGTELLLSDPTRPTTRKTRVLDRNKQLLRLDKEDVTDLGQQLQDNWLERIESYLTTQKPQLLIFEDYNKGTLTPGVIQRITTLCKKLGIILAVDPKKKNFFAYQCVDLFKPNWREVTEALTMTTSPDLDQLKQVHRSLSEQLHHRVSLITLSDQGVFYQQEELAELIPVHARQVVDVSGAGDTVIAVAAAAFAITQDVSCMANLANLAGGLVCEKVGTASIGIQELEQESARLAWI